MSDAAILPKARASRGWVILAAFVAVDFVLGAAAGVYAGFYFGQGDGATEAVAQGTDHTAPDGQDAVARQEIDVGRITVVIPQDNPPGGNLHLLITPLVVGHPEDGAEPAAHDADGGGAAGPTPELRDAFIEYLSQLHAAEVRGSLGLATMRAELLRRARAVAPGLNASAVLIQEFVIQ